MKHNRKGVQNAIHSLFFRGLLVRSGKQELGLVELIWLGVTSGDGDV